MWGGEGGGGGVPAQVFLLGCVFHSVSSVSLPLLVESAGGDHLALHTSPQYLPNGMCVCVERYQINKEAVQ